MAVQIDADELSTPEKRIYPHSRGKRGTRQANGGNAAQASAQRPERRRASRCKPNNLAEAFAEPDVAIEKGHAEEGALSTPEKQLGLQSQRKRGSRQADTSERASDDGPRTKQRRANGGKAHTQAETCAEAAEVAISGTIVPASVDTDVRPVASDIVRKADFAGQSQDVQLLPPLLVQLAAPGSPYSTLQLTGCLPGETSRIAEWMQVYSSAGRSSHEGQPAYTSEDGKYLLYHSAQPSSGQGWWLGHTVDGTTSGSAFAFLPLGHADWWVLDGGSAQQARVVITTMSSSEENPSTGFASETPSLQNAEPLPLVDDRIEQVAGASESAAVPEPPQTPPLKMQETPTPVRNLARLAGDTDNFLPASIGAESLLRGQEKQQQRSPPWSRDKSPRLGFSASDAELSVLALSRPASPAPSTPARGLTRQTALSTARSFSNSGFDLKWAGRALGPGLFPPSKPLPLGEMAGRPFLHVASLQSAEPQRLVLMPAAETPAFLTAEDLKRQDELLKSFSNLSLKLGSAARTSGLKLEVARN